MMGWGFNGGMMGGGMMGGGMMGIGGMGMMGGPIRWAASVR